MTESRPEAVARAIARAAAKREFGPRYEGYESSHRELGEAFAQAAIEASDAWLKQRGWKAVPRDMTDPMRSANYSGPITSWQASWDRAPSPEEPDQ